MANYLSTLWLFNISPWYRWHIEIDGLPNLKMGGSFHGKLLVITRWSIFFGLTKTIVEKDT